MGFDIRENVSPFFFIIKYVFNMANINKIRISGTSYDIQDSNATKVVNITQAEYDALPASAKTANILYNITDAEAVDLSQYWTSAETQSAITEATSGKVSTSDFNTYSGSVDTALNSKASQTDLNALSGTVTAHTSNTSIHVSPEQIAAWNAKSDFSGNYNDLSNKPTIPSKTSDLTNDSDFATTGDVQTATNDMATKTWVGQQGYLTQHQDISGKLDVSAFNTYSGSVDTTINSKASQASVDALNGVVTAHTASTTIHVTAQDKTNWNNKSDFSGDYNDLVNKPTIPTVPTSNTAFTNDAGYITIDAISGKVDTTTYNTYTAATDTAIDGKQATLVSGTNIKTINNESILGSGNITIEGGGGKAVVGGRGISVTSGETADTVSFNLPISAGTSSDSIIGGYFGNKSMSQYGFAFGDNAKCMNSGSACMAFGSNVTANSRGSFVTGCYNEGTNEAQAVFGRYSVNNKANGTFGDSGNTLFSVGNGTSSARHNAFEIRQNGDIYLNDGSKLQDTVSATAANTTALGGLKLVKLSQSEYDALATKDSNTLYVIVN